MLIGYERQADVQRDRLSSFDIEECSYKLWTFVEMLMNVTCYIGLCLYIWHVEISSLLLGSETLFFLFTERSRFSGQWLQPYPQQCLHVLYICGPGWGMEAWRCGLYVSSYRTGQCPTCQNITLPGEIWPSRKIWS